MAEIRCGHCNGVHGSVAEVRACAAHPPAAPVVVPVQSAPPEPAPHVGRVDAATWRAEDLAGPDALGRSVVVLPGATPPAPWRDCPRVPAAVDRLDELQAAWSGRRRIVVEAPATLDPAAAAAATAAAAVPPWELGVAYEIPGERLAHLVFSNAIDARDPAGARWAPLDLAVRLGATPGGDGADVVAPDGTPLLLDGGPLTPFDPAVTGAAVVPAVALRVGTLLPIRPAEPDAALAPDQLAAVAHTGGGARIIAPAGAGKTRVLTERARLLLDGWGVPARSTCLVAFNRRAADEIRDRTGDLPTLHVRTLNSLALAIVNGDGPFLAPADGRRRRTLGEVDVRRILGGLVTVPRRANSDPLARWLEALTAVRLGFGDPAAVEKDFGGDVDGLVDVVPAYRARLAEADALDFDEQVVAAIERLCTDPAARRAARAACGVLLVDEFQDLTPAHLLLVRLLAGPAADCFGVGDDDQTIYGYAGASPEWLVRFATWFPGAGDHALEVNYRCAPAVVQAASNTLSRLAVRVPKTIRPAPGRVDDADALRVDRSTDPVDTTVATVRALLGRGVAPADVAVLTRVNATLLPVQVLLAAAGIPTTRPVERAFLDRAGVRAALAWIDLATTDRLRSGAIAEAARRPSRGLSQKVVEWMAEQRDVDGLLRLADRLAERDGSRVRAFADDVVTVGALAATATTADVLTAVRDRIGLGEVMDTLDRSRGTVDRSAHGDDLAALIAVARIDPDPATFPTTLRRALEAGVADPGGVHLATVHRVKGREWPFVVVHGVEEGLFPHRLAGDRDEERRVFHVALTRSSILTTVVVDAAAPGPFPAELAEPGTPEARPAPAAPSTGRPGAAGGRGAPGRGVIGISDADPADPELIAALKRWRVERARRDKVPAYVIMRDTTIEAIVARSPRTLAELAACPGIGPSRLENYGDEILAVLS